MEALIGKVEGGKVPDDLFFFRRPEVNIGEQREHEVILDCRASIDLTSQVPVEFNIPGSTSDFIDLNKTELLTTLRIKKKEGFTWNNGSGVVSEVEAKDGLKYPKSFLSDDVELATPVDCFLQTQWKDVVLALNDTIITSTNHDQAYRAYLDLLLRTREYDMKVSSMKMLYTKDEGKRRKDEPNPYKAHNRGGIERS